MCCLDKKVLKRVSQLWNGRENEDHFFFFFLSERTMIEIKIYEQKTKIQIPRFFLANYFLFYCTSNWKVLVGSIIREMHKLKLTSIQQLNEYIIKAHTIAHMNGFHMQITFDNVYWIAYMKLTSYIKDKLVTIMWRIITCNWRFRRSIDLS